MASSSNKSKAKMANGALNIVILVPPQAQPLDVTGPLAAFREAHRQTQGEVRYGVKLMSMTGRRTLEIDGMTLVADLSLDDGHVEADTLLVAGTHDYHQARGMPQVSRWLNQMAPKVRRLGSVCTGAFFLAEAGLLKGHRATTHWQQADELASLYPDANVEPDAIYVQDGNLCTSAGITAGIDMALKLIEDDHGRELALKIARRLVVFLRRPGGQSQYSTHLAAQVSDESRIQSILHWILEHLEQDLSLPRLAEKGAMSVRSLSRFFREETGTTPGDFVESARVEAAQRLLEDSQMPLQKIAAQCGFTNVDLMRRAFLRKIGIGPSDYKKRFAV